VLVLLCAACSSNNFVHFCWELAGVQPHFVAWHKGNDLTRFSTHKLTTMQCQHLCSAEPPADLECDHFIVCEAVAHLA
jgi:hypothetical protein